MWGGWNLLVDGWYEIVMGVLGATQGHQEAMVYWDMLMAISNELLLATTGLEQTIEQS